MKRNAALTCVWAKQVQGGSRLLNKYTLVQSHCLKPFDIPEWLYALRRYLPYLFILFLFLALGMGTLSWWTLQPSIINLVTGEPTPSWICRGFSTADHMNGNGKKRLQDGMESVSIRWIEPPRWHNIGQRSRRRTCRTGLGRFSCVISSLCDDSVIRSI